MFTLKTHEEYINTINGLLANAHFLEENEDPSKPFYADPSTFKGNIDDFRVEIPGLED